MAAAERTGKGKSAELSVKAIITLTEMFPEIVQSLLTGGTSTAATLGSKGKKVVGAMDDAWDAVKKNDFVDGIASTKKDIYRKLDPQTIKRYNGKKLNKQEYARLCSAVKTNHPQETGIIIQNLDNKKGDPNIIYTVLVDEDGWVLF